jgi:hypothetical protein
MEKFNLHEVLEYLEPTNTGGGCTAEVAQIIRNNVKHDVVVTDLNGTDAPNDREGMIIGIYKGDAWINGEMAEEFFQYAPENMKDGVAKLAELLNCKI